MSTTPRFRWSPAGLLVPAEHQQRPERTNPVVEVFVNYETVFPEEPATFDEFKRLVRGLSRTDALFWSARLNILVSDSTKDTKDVQGHCIGVFFSREEIDRINSFALAHGGRSHVTVFFRGQLLELMRWVALLCADQEGDGQTFNNAEVRRQFARAALLASDVWQRRVYGNRLESTEVLDDRRRAVLGAVRLANMETSAIAHPMLTLARGYALFAGRMHARASEVGQLFEQATGMPMDDYYSMAAYVAAEGLVRPVEGLGDPSKCGMLHAGYCEATEAFGALARAYFAHEAQTAAELRHALWATRDDASEDEAHVLTMKAFRDRPLLRTADGRALLLDPKSFVERLAVGPLFQLVRVDRKRQNHWFAVFGEVFEKYCQDLFGRIYPTAPGLVQRFIPNPEGTDETGARIELADGLLVDQSDAALIEMKAVWIPDAVVSPEQDSNAYLDEIRRRFVVQDGTEQAERPKGVGQLARTLERLATGAWIAESADLACAVRIMPILLVHDPHLDAPVHSHFLAQEFAALVRGGVRVDDWSEMETNGRRIAHLIVITLDDLETLETSSSKFALLDCLRDYASACPDRLTSLHNFLAASSYRAHLRYNAWLAERATELLDRTMRRLFPGHELDADAGAS